MQPLATMDELPQDYRDALTAQNLVPLWPSLRAVLPPGRPQRRTQPTCWRYETLRPLLMRSGQLTPIEKAERRVLVLANPGHGHDRMQASAVIYLGMQLLLPGERAPSHRHTPNAVRMIVEGEGAYTTVDGERCAMSRGDLILTPTGLWHEHGHDGHEPVTWLDVLDLPLFHFLEASYAVEGGVQPGDASEVERRYAHGGLLPAPLFRRTERRAYPILRYPWKNARAALLELDASCPSIDAVQMAYVNPETGDDCQHVLGFSALMLRPAERISLPVRSPAAVFHVIEGDAVLEVEGLRLTLAPADTCCVPGHTAASLRNASNTQPAFLFVADESPLHRKLGIYEST